MTKKLWILALFFAGSITMLQAQSPEQIVRLQYLASQLKQKSQAEKAEAVQVANEKGWPVRIEDKNGRITELMRLDENGMPMYYTTFNAEGAALINSDELYTGGAAGLTLSGAGQTLGIWDGGAVLGTHQELTGRVTQGDSPASTHWHSTHVAGTMIASGVWDLAKGMSPAASLSAYDWDNDASEMATEAVGGMKVSQHSYGQITGWYNDGYNWYWYGNTLISETEDYNWGFYDSFANAWDEIAHNAPNYLIVKSAGNDRGEGPASGSNHYFWNGSNWELSTTSRDLDGGASGFDCIGHRGVGKNIMTVGAVSAASAMSSFSGWGPTDDGRIKPDIVAKGVTVLSTHSAGIDQYANSNGTSMSGPMVSGSIGLLLEHQENLHPGVALRSATMKGLILHTATDLGNAGPDYIYGWGLMNTEAAAAIMTDQVASPVHIYENTLADGQSVNMKVKATGNAPLKATIIWNDVPGTPVAIALDPPDLMLVNDLDMRLTDAGGTISSPYILDPANPANVATTGDNFRDNIEVINIASPVAGAIYTLTINHKGTLSSPQNYSLIITGNEDFDYTYLFNASDNSSNYGGSWTNGSNEGNGFGNWVLSSGTNGGFAGHFTGDPSIAGITGMTNPSFGLYANPDDNGNYANADRTFAGPLSIGSTFSVDWAVNWDSNGEGNKGINLYTEGTSGAQIININMGGSSAITINGNPMFNNYGTNLMTLNFEYVSNGNLRVYGTGRDGSETYDQTIAVAGAPDAVRFYASGLASGDQRQPYFNNLSITTNFSNVAANTDAIAVGDLTIDANLTLDNLLIENGNSVTIEPTKSLTVIATTDNQAGTAALFLQSDATGTASLLHNTADVDMTIQRYLSGDANTANAKYHTVSVPLTAGSNPQTGLFMGSYLYRFDFAIQDYVSMGTSTTTPLEVDEGYLLYYPNDNITYDFAGKANNGNFATAVEYGVPFNYNLVPNPYPSAIDWDAASGWTKTNMNNAIYIYNTAQSTGNGEDINVVWASYVNGTGANGGSRYIPAGQAFFVQSNAAAPALSMTNEVRVHNSQAFYKNTTEETETLRLFAHSGDFTDEIVVRYLPESSIDFDGQYDALKFKNWNTAPNIYSLTPDKTELSINSIPYSAETYVMEVGFERGEAGEAVIEVQGMESFGDWVTIFLEDLLTGVRIDLREQNSYRFIHETDNDPLRFTLWFMGVTSTDELSNANDIRIWSAEQMLFLSHFADAPAQLEVFDLQGRLLYSKKLNGTGSTSVSELPLDQVLIVRLSSNLSVTNQKVVIR
ncbi:MAG: S8 family serine peptidase [Bacteroidales bacterium]|nr:S8 family serine peptidase [Bacteroidales bacterium]